MNDTPILGHNASHAKENGLAENANCVRCGAPCCDHGGIAKIEKGGPFTMAVCRECIDRENAKTVARPASQWIPVSERLPEVEETPLGPRSIKVLVWALGWDDPLNKGRFYPLLGEWRIEGQHGKQTVTHWRYMPEPPKV